MTLPANTFKDFHPGKDPYYNEIPVLRLDDLRKPSRRRPSISIMISTWNRKSQLARSLECYARQSFRDFEILINDDGSTQNIPSLISDFSPYLNLQYFFTPRSQWVSCPSKAFKMMLPSAKGKIIAITHPEIMISYDALQFVRDALLSDKVLEDTRFVPGSVVDPRDSVGSGKKWVSLRPGFILPDNYPSVDAVDWHSNIEALHSIPNYDVSGGFAGRSNPWHREHLEYPWWFFGATYKKDFVWTDLPEFVGHGTIDMWLVNYRIVNGYVDIVPKKVMCYHLPHVTSAVAPEGELGRSKAEKRN